MHDSGTSYGMTMRLGTSRRSRIAVLVASLVAVSSFGVAAAATASSHVSVYFLRGEQLAVVQRPGKTPLDAMRRIDRGSHAR